ncbi:Hypothetical predicted protein, partial [Scomber scombrus]
MPNNRAKGANASTVQANSTATDNAVLNAIDSLRTDITAELVTLKKDICNSVDAKIDSLAENLRSEIAGVRTELQTDLRSVKSETGDLATRVERGANH